MEQEYYNAPVQEESLPGQPPQPTTKKIDPHFSILIVQVGVCVAILLACMIIKLFFGGFFAQMKDWYQKNIATDTNVQQVLSGEVENGGTGGPLETEPAILTAAALNGFIVPIKGEVSSPFGYRNDPFTGAYTMHHGLDIAADTGTPIVAALEGTVVLVNENNSDYGKYIIIEHGGFKTLYGHCSELLVREGERVAAAQTIARCGSTGRSTGPHLHFEIRIGTARIDPAPFLGLTNTK